MGQKTNPTALRLNKTNKSFDSSWYNQLHYNRLVGDDIAVKPFIEQVLTQAGLPKNLWSFSPIPKRGRGLILYLSPNRSRASKSAKLRLRQPPISSNKTMERRGGSALSYAQSSNTTFTPATAFHFKERKALFGGGGMVAWERRFFVHSLLTQLVCNTSSRSKFMSHSDSSFLQKAHILSWLHGGEQAMALAPHRIPPHVGGGRGWRVYIISN